jgi:5-methylcytosine-specific restriction enzyme A
MSTKLRTLRHKVAPASRVKVRQPQKTVDPFYMSVPWRALMEGIIKQRGRRCEDTDHDLSRPRTGIRIFGDHIRELKDGGAPLDQNNILLRCGACHTRKTAASRGDRR